MSTFHYQQFDIVQDHAAMKVGTDSDLLGTLAPGGQRILDIGTGTGVIALMMAQRFPMAQLTAVEIDDNAVQDARVNFAASPFSERIRLHHMSFQDYLAKTSEAEETKADDKGTQTAVSDREVTEQRMFDCVVCNPPYFDKSLEPEDVGRTRARHTSSLPFSTLAQGAYHLLEEGGVFSVCIPEEVLANFNAECLFAGFSLKNIYKVQTVPTKPAKRFIVVHQKGCTETPQTQTFCMRNADHTRSQWYQELMKDFLVNPSVY